MRIVHVNVCVMLEFQKDSCINYSEFKLVGVKMCSLQNRQNNDNKNALRMVSVAVAHIFFVFIILSSAIIDFYVTFTNEFSVLFNHYISHLNSVHLSGKEDFPHISRAQLVRLSLIERFNWKRFSLKHL